MGTLGCFHPCPRGMIYLKGWAVGEGRLEKTGGLGGSGSSEYIVVTPGPQVAPITRFSLGFLGTQEPRPPHVMKVVRGEVLGEVSGIFFWSHVDVNLAFIPRMGRRRGADFDARWLGHVLSFGCSQSPC